MNQDRDYHIFEEPAYYLDKWSQTKSEPRTFLNSEEMYMLWFHNNRLVSKCILVGKFRKKKGGIKVHTFVRWETQIPAFFISQQPVFTIQKL